MSHDLVGCFANIWLRQKVFSSKGETIGGHKHKYDHLSILAKGSVEVSVDGKTKIFHAPTFVVIRADKVHDITSLTDEVLWYCTFASRDINGDVFDPTDNCPLDLEAHERLDKGILDNIQVLE
jgi:hypothetical protein